MTEKYGFVYIWYDRKHKRYYIGAHWGNENDGYICSSTWMKNAYRRRPEDFRRRVLKRVYTSRSDMFAEEYKWLHFIGSAEIGTKYYNLTQHHNGHWSLDPTKHKIIENANRARCLGVPLTEGHKQNISNGLKGKGKGRKLSDETRAKMSASKTGKPSPKGMQGKKHTDEWKRAQSEYAKQQWQIRKNNINGCK